MTPYQSQRLRFGILAARHMLERDRLTDSQVEDLEECVLAGWKYRDAQKAFDRERDNIAIRAFYTRIRAGHDRR